MAIITISGPEDSGRDTVARMLVERYPARFSILKTFTTGPASELELSITPQSMSMRERNNLLICGGFHGRYAWAIDRSSLSGYIRGSSKTGILIAPPSGIIELRKVMAELTGGTTCLKSFFVDSDRWQHVHQIGAATNAASEEKLRVEHVLWPEQAARYGGFTIISHDGSLTEVVDHILHNLA